METQFTAGARNPVRNPAGPLYAGYGLLAVSLFFYALVGYLPTPSAEHLLTIFFVHYFIALGYVGVLLFYKALGIRKSWSREHIHLTLLSLNLFFISAYALNRVVTVFDDSTQWLCVYILTTSLTTLSYRFFHSLPAWINRIQHVILGSALMFYLYLSIFVANYYVFGCLGTLAFGIGAHIFIPMAILAACILLIRYTAAEKISAYWVAGGTLVTLIISIIFVVEWNARVSKIETFANQSVLYQDSALPVWISVGQEIRNDWISQRILKSDLVYTTAPEKFGEWQLFPRRSDWEEIRKHDPLVFLASLKAKSTLSQDDRIKILRTINNPRYQTGERLWSGDDLTTSYIVSDIDIYPELRLAYTEKYLNIRNNNTTRRQWGSTGEAIYTFQLPEGSVVSSLSLWVNGKEEKGILTSKQKATKAYKTIVGIEQRDPSVVHWKEGNTVTVSVFPCTHKEERKFKIGITSPLPVKEGKTIYENISFYGPDASQAKETTRIRFIGSSAGISIPAGFTKNKYGDYLSEHAYDPDLEISFPAKPLKPNRFSFDEFMYSMQEYKPEYQSVNFDKIYLDLNKSWTNSELEAMEGFLAKHTFFLYTGGEFVNLNEKNWSFVTEEFRNRNFSLFPFHLIKDPDRCLVITKGDEFTPQLSDLKESTFGKSLTDFFSHPKKIKVFNLAGGISTYINSLRELRAFEFQQGNTDALKKCLSENIFTVIHESDTAIVLHDAAMVIYKNKDKLESLPDNAPDHLARLFAYNDIMRKVGGQYFSDDFIDDALVKEANTAYVVSPVSSLIVLESKKDYERFNIADQENSLYNASRQSSGAVPEPHEWVLIIVFVLFVLYIKIRH